MLIPLAFWAFGVQHQILVDIRTLIRPHLVNHTIKNFSRISISNPDLRLQRKPTKLLKGTSQKEFLTSLQRYYGIDYRVPCGARYTNIDSSSISCITATDTLEHIPLDDIRAIFRECHRILSDDGLMSFRIDYKDHYSYFDDSISAYNFLRYHDNTWTFYSPALHYQNCLRHVDYLILLETCGFEIVDKRCINGTAEDIKTIKTLQIDKKFKDYTLEELAVKRSVIVVRKSRRNNILPNQ